MNAATDRPMRAIERPRCQCVLRLFDVDIVKTFETQEGAGDYCRRWEERFIEGWDSVRVAYAETMLALTDELQAAGVDPNIVLQAIKNLDKRAK